jgi:hypothetical protein
MSAGDFMFDDSNGSNFPVASTTAESSVESDSFYYNNNTYDHHREQPDGRTSSLVGGGFYPDRIMTTAQDASEIVQEMYFALLYLLSNPEEFKKTLHPHSPRGATTLNEWNAELEEEDYDAEEEEESVVTSGGTSTSATPLPFVVFADDAEVVLPQAHTASQLFGIEIIDGIELEAAAGFPALSQLFLRWLGEYCHARPLFLCMENFHRHCVLENIIASQLMGFFCCFGFVIFVLVCLQLSCQVEIT